MSQKKDDWLHDERAVAGNAELLFFIYPIYIPPKVWAGEAINGSFKSPHIHPYSPVTFVLLFPPHKMILQQTVQVEHRRTNGYSSTLQPTYLGSAYRSSSAYLNSK